LEGPLPAGIYTISEDLLSLPAGWSLTAITVIDPDGDIESVGDEVTGIATINLDHGETVKVTFTNTYIAPL
jgi:hypothetical protein